MITSLKKWPELSVTILRNYAELNATISTFDKIIALLKIDFGGSILFANGIHIFWLFRQSCQFF